MSHCVTLDSVTLNSLTSNSGASNLPTVNSAKRNSEASNSTILKVHQCRFENLPIFSSSYENNMLKISH